jgi:pyrroloquinoline quinone biosynthesis protein D
MSPSFTPESVPHFARGFRFRHDTVRDQWVVLGPERAFVPDEIAIEVLRLVDGAASLATITDTLAARYDAPREQIEGDVLIMANDLAVKGVLR